MKKRNTLTIYNIDKDQIQLIFADDFHFFHQWGWRADTLRRDFDTLLWLCDISSSPLKIPVCPSLWILCLPARCKQRYILKTLQAIANAAQCYECHKTLLIITRSITYFFYNRSRYQDRWGICTTLQNGRDRIIYIYHRIISPSKSTPKSG